MVNFPPHVIDVTNLADTVTSMLARLRRGGNVIKQLDVTVRFSTGAIKFVVTHGDNSQGFDTLGEAVNYYNDIL